MLDFAAGLLDKPQQGVGDAPFDLLGRYLDYAGMGSWRREPTVCSVLVASTGISRRAAASFRQPRQHDAVVDGGRGRWVAGLADRLGDPEGLAGRECASSPC